MKTTKKNKLSKNVTEELHQLLQLPHIEILGQNLRRMFIDYLEYELKAGAPAYFDEFLFPLNCLFDFLDILANEKATTAGSNKTNKSKPVK